MDRKLVYWGLAFLIIFAILYSANNYSSSLKDEFFPGEQERGRFKLECLDSNCNEIKATITNTWFNPAVKFWWSHGEQVSFISELYEQGSQLDIDPNIYEVKENHVGIVWDGCSAYGDGIISQINNFKKRSGTISKGGIHHVVQYKIYFSYIGFINRVNPTGSCLDKINRNVGSRFSGYVIFSKKTIDSDGDGVPDSEDKCPNTPGLPELSGCPDTDGDGIADPDDKCPREAGIPELNGCPPVCTKDEDCLPKDYYTAKCIGYECVYTPIKVWIIRNEECVEVNQIDVLDETYYETKEECESALQAPTVIISLVILLVFLGGIVVVAYLVIRKFVLKKKLW